MQFWGLRHDSVINSFHPPIVYWTTYHKTCKNRIARSRKSIPSEGYCFRESYKFSHVDRFCFLIFYDNNFQSMQNKSKINLREFVYYEKSELSVFRTVIPQNWSWNPWITGSPTKIGAAAGKTSLDWLINSNINQWIMFFLSRLKFKMQ